MEGGPLKHELVATPSHRLLGALYPALYRLEQQGLLDTEWGTSDNNRKAKFYSLTTAGRKRLKTETERWAVSAGAVNAALKAQEV